MYFEFTKHVSSIPWTSMHFDFTKHWLIFAHSLKAFI